jgi:hypothetical protein
MRFEQNSGILLVSIEFVMYQIVPAPIDIGLMNQKTAGLRNQE